MEKTKLGILLGMVAGIIDVIPMLAQKLSWDANISAFCLWVVCGFLIARTDIGVKGALKGVFISFLVLLPAAILIGWKELFSLVPIFAMAVILGSALGVLIERYGE